MMEVTSELSYLVEMQSKRTMQIYPIIIVASGFLLEAKTLIEYNSFNLEENKDEGAN